MKEKVELIDGAITVVLEKSGVPEFGYPVRITISTLALSGSLEGEAYGTQDFIIALHQLHKTLKGEARLRFLDNEHLISFRCDELGAMFVRIEIAEGTPARSQLIVGLNLDQSYLPNLISSFEKLFSLAN